MQNCNFVCCVAPRSVQSGEDGLLQGQQGSEENGWTQEDGSTDGRRLNVITGMARRVYGRHKTDVLIGRPAFYQLAAAGMYSSQFKIKQRVAIYLASSTTRQQLCLLACNVDSAEVFGTTAASSTALRICI
jgi:hypothetical protein